MSKDDSTMLAIGNNKQFFFDNVIIEAIQDLTRAFHQPKKIDQNPLLIKDQPWEHVTYFTCNGWSILHDKKDGLFKCWYMDWHWDPNKYAELTSHGVSRTDAWVSLKTSLLRECYAYSEDGINWIKPRLGILRENGYDTNVILGSKKFGTVYDFSVIDDPFESDKLKRFKTLYVHMAPGISGLRIEAAYSVDGIHWVTYDKLPCFGILGSRLNDVLMVSYDTYSRQYILNTRHYYMFPELLNPHNPKTNSFLPPYYPEDFAKMNKRRIFQTESSDFLHWGEPYMILCPDDEEDNLDDTFYGMIQFPMGNIRVGLLNVFHYVANTMDVQIVYSHDGKNWRRAGQRQPWLTTGLSGSWDQFMVNASSPPLEIGDEMWFYYGGSKNHHDWWITGLAEGLNVPEVKDMSRVGYALGLAKLRLDGFYSLDAGPVREGILVTRPFISNGKQIVINAECDEGGYIEGEIANLSDEVFPGYSRKDCDTFRGDEISHSLSWKGKVEIPVERVRKLRFYMRNAKLYSFQITDK